MTSLHQKEVSFKDLERSISLASLGEMNFCGSMI